MLLNFQVAAKLWKSKPNTTDSSIFLEFLGINKYYKISLSNNNNNKVNNLFTDVLYTQCIFSDKLTATNRQ